MASILHHGGTFVNCLKPIDDFRRFSWFFNVEVLAFCLFRRKMSIFGERLFLFFLANPEALWIIVQLF